MTTGSSIALATPCVTGLNPPAACAMAWQAPIDMVVERAVPARFAAINM